MTTRHRNEDPRWWDQTDEGYALRLQHGTPDTFDLLDMHVAALEGDSHASAYAESFAEHVSEVRRLLEAARSIDSKYQH